MTHKPQDRPLRYPYPEPPGETDVIEIAEGVLWLRLPLPFRLNHINIYLIDDGDGWAVLDTGIANAATKELWTFLISERLGGRKLTRLIATHYHPDHIGLAGWFAETHGLPLVTTETTYLQCASIAFRPQDHHEAYHRDFYLKNGLAAEPAQRAALGLGYLSLVTPLPPFFERIVAGGRLAIGGRIFEVLTGDGHAPEQAMLYCARDKLFFSADQVLDKISPNISVWATEPHGDPLGLYLRSLAEIEAKLPGDVAVLPSHHMPFIGLHARAGQLAAHHEERCEMLLKAADEPKTAADLVPALFPRPLDAHEMAFAFGEALAHVNHLLRESRLIRVEPQNGLDQVRARR